MARPKAIDAAYLTKRLLGLPNPKGMPREIRMEVRFEEATEVHVIPIAGCENADAVADALAAYHEICKGLPKVRMLSEAREATVRARLKQCGMDKLRELFARTAASDFLCGKNDRKWTANFDWLMNETNMAKVLNGNFDNRGGASEGAPQSFDVDAAFERAVSRSYGN